MADTTFVDGDRIVLHCERGKWRAEMIPHHGGVVAPARGAIYDTPEDAVAATSAIAKTIARYPNFTFDF